MSFEFDLDGQRPAEMTHGAVTRGRSVVLLRLLLLCTSMGRLYEDLSVPSLCSGSAILVRACKVELFVRPALSCGGPFTCLCGTQDVHCLEGRLLLACPFELFVKTKFALLSLCAVAISFLYRPAR